MGLTFTFGGISSATYHLIVTNAGLANAPERDVTLVTIPGRNGVLAMDNGRYKPVSVFYEVACGSLADMEAFNAAVMALTGYRRLTDSAHPGEYRMALAPEGIEWEMIGKHTGKAKIVFRSQPERWLTGGEIYGERITGPTGSITNPTGYVARPLIKVYVPVGTATDTATITINGTAFTVRRVTSSNYYYYIDTDLMSCVVNDRNRNELFSGDFPVLSPGANAISLSGVYDYIQIMPRWYKI